MDVCYVNITTVEAVRGTQQLIQLFFSFSWFDYSFILDFTYNLFFISIIISFTRTMTGASLS